MSPRWPTAHLAGLRSGVASASQPARRKPDPRAAQQKEKGTITGSEERKIDRKADKTLDK